ncbi:MAG: Rieske 2Fe-2S domain-containing protein [Saprospiraceae bacterium]|nr:Rieske 2Fe-2S domain-containing protein [Saprospiraceae bacterium]
MIRNLATVTLTTPLGADFYRDKAGYERVIQRVFADSWQFLAGPECAVLPMTVMPVTLLQGSLNEPLLLSKDKDGQEHILSNVCTHRGNILVEKPGPMRQLVCRYHARCFGLDGTCLRQPGLDKVTDFPDVRDHLPRPAKDSWAGLRFVRLQEGESFAEWIAPLIERTGFLPWDTLHHLPDQSRDYQVNAHWALYCDNYLEGLHIPFVHPALRDALDLQSYPIHTFPSGSVQIGLAKAGEPAFDLPPDHPDAGLRVYGWYFWLFPNIMFNIYPWGLSLNIVEPLGPDLTRIRFLAYAFEQASGGPDSHALHDTELEDEDVVEQVHRGTSSLLYQHGRLVPEWEKGVVHFHRLLMDRMR